MWTNGKFMKQGKGGFSLIELMIVVAIISILVSISVPSLVNYLVQSRRVDGISALLLIMQQQEHYYSENHTYTTSLANLGYTVNTSNQTVTSSQEFYEIAASNCTGQTLTQCVLLTATPIGSQAGDGDITLNSLGQKLPAGHWFK